MPRLADRLGGLQSPQRLALIVAGVVLGGVGFVPLFAGPGYEAALAAGLVLPSTCAIATALEVSRRRPTAVGALAQGVSSGATLFALGLVISLLHGVRAGFCDARTGTLLYALGGGAGALLGGAWGALAGLTAEQLVVRPRRRTLVALALAVAGPAGGVLLSLWRFYASPMVFAFDPFFGYFAGPLYDTVVDGMPELLTYRLGSLATLVAAGIGAAHLRRDDGGRFRLAWRGSPGFAALGALAALASVGVTAAGPTLGHYSTPASIRRALGRALAGERCEVVYSRPIPEREAALIARDCDAHVRELEAWFGVHAPARTTVFLFASAAEKARYMGASRTQVAKPWRGEIYVQTLGYPHPVLRHELAHVVAGAAASGPFRVAGPLWGIVPDPGRIEGVAEAAAPDEDADLTPAEWARAMRTLGILPPVARVFRLSFLAENATKAYTVAGAFMTWLHATHGSAAVTRWYAGESLEEVTQKSLTALEVDWHAALDQVVITPEMEHAALARFERPPIFQRRCPRVVDGLAAVAAAELASGDHRSARETYERLLAIDARDVGARVGVATCSLRALAVDDARERLQAVAVDETLPLAQRAGALERVGDLELAAGQVEQARERYREVEQALVDDDRLRSLELKRSLADDPLARRAVVALLIGDPRHGADFDVAAAELGAWAALRPEDGTPHYLLGKNYYLRSRWELAASRLDAALERNLELGRLKREALRQRLIVACALGDLTAAERVFQRWSAEAAPGLRSALREGTRAFAQRCGVRAAARGR